MSEKSLKKGIWQFIKFGLVGVSNTLISQIVYMVFTAIGVHYLIASVIAFIISVLNAFFLQIKFVFQSNEKWWKVLLKTYISYSFTGLFLNNVLLVLWIEVIKIENFTPFLTNFINGFGLNISNKYLAESLAPLLNMVITIPTNFVLNKFWAYRQKKEKTTGEENEQLEK